MSMKVLLSGRFHGTNQQSVKRLLKQHNIIAYTRMPVAGTQRELEHVVVDRMEKHDTVSKSGVRFVRGVSATLITLKDLMSGVKLGIPESRVGGLRVSNSKPKSRLTIPQQRMLQQLAEMCASSTDDGKIGTEYLSRIVHGMGVRFIVKPHRSTLVRHICSASFGQLIKRL